MISVTLDIAPIAKGRPRFTRLGRAYTPAKTRDNETALKSLLISKYRDKPLEGAVALSIVFLMPRPKGVSVKKRPWPTVKPDLDNLIKSVLDAGNGVLWLDDSQVVHLSVEKKYGPTGAIWLSAGVY